MWQNPVICRQALLFAEDGLVRDGDQLYFHFQRYPWDLGHPERHPPPSEHRRRVEKRLKAGLEAKDVKPLAGEYWLGLHPFIFSYYHFMADLLPALAEGPQVPVLIPQGWPSHFEHVLHQAGFATERLVPRVYRIEKLWIPGVTPHSEDWPLAKLEALERFFQQAKLWPEARPLRHRLYLSRQTVKRRHLVNEAEFWPILAEAGFERVEWDDVPVLEQAQILAETSHWIAPHGAGLSNMLFISPQARILEIRPLKESGQFCFEHLAALRWPSYEALVPPPQPRFELPCSLLQAVLARWFKG